MRDISKQIAGLGSMFWFAGWLLTLGYAHLSVLQSIAAVVIWPYYLGSALR